MTSGVNGLRFSEVPKGADGCSYVRNILHSCYDKGHRLGATAVTQTEHLISGAVPSSH